MGFTKGWSIKAIHPRIMKKIREEVVRRNKTEARKVDQTEVLNAILANHYKLK